MAITYDSDLINAPVNFYGVKKLSKQRLNNILNRLINTVPREVLSLILATFGEVPIVILEGALPVLPTSPRLLEHVKTRPLNESIPLNEVAKVLMSEIASTGNIYPLYDLNRGMWFIPVEETVPRGNFSGLSRWVNLETVIHSFFSRYIPNIGKVTIHGGNILIWDILDRIYRSLRLENVLSSLEVPSILINDMLYIPIKYSRYSGRQISPILKKEFMDMRDLARYLLEKQYLNEVSRTLSEAIISWLEDLVTRGEGYYVKHIPETFRQVLPIFRLGSSSTSLDVSYSEGELKVGALSKIELSPNLRLELSLEPETNMFLSYLTYLPDTRSIIFPLVLVPSKYITSPDIHPSERVKRFNLCNLLLSYLPNLDIEIARKLNTVYTVLRDAPLFIMKLLNGVELINDAYIDEEATVCLHTVDTLLDLVKMLLREVYNIHKLVRNIEEGKNVNESMNFPFIINVKELEHPVLLRIVLNDVSNLERLVQQVGKALPYVESTSSPILIESLPSGEVLTRRIVFDRDKVVLPCGEDREIIVQL